MEQGNANFLIPVYVCLSRLDSTKKFLDHLIGLWEMSGQMRDKVGDERAFQFDYEAGPFTNRFIWQQASSSWRFELTYHGGEQLCKFATKEMVLMNRTQKEYR